MDIEQFIQATKPSKQRGKLSMFESEVLELCSRGYSVSDIQKWLQLKQIEVTERSIYKKIRSLKQKQWPSAKSTPEKEVEKQNIKTALPHNLNRFKTTGFKSKDEREAFASQFIKDNPISPTVKRLIEKNAKKEQS